MFLMVGSPLVFGYKGLDQSFAKLSFIQVKIQIWNTLTDKLNILKSCMLDLGC